MDEEGCVWNAQLISGDLVRYAPDGSVERRIGMPVRNITSVMFGGDALDELYVTSMARVKHPAVHDRFAREAKPQFLAGSLFRVTGLGDTRSTGTALRRLMPSWFGWRPWNAGRRSDIVPLVLTHPCGERVGPNSSSG